MESRAPAPVPEDPIDLFRAVGGAREELERIREELTRVTGGAAPGEVLAELAQTLSAELGATFEELPMPRFTGRIAGGGFAGALLRRRLPHRLLLGRYLQATVPSQAGVGYTSSFARIGLIAIGSDGVTRVGQVWEQVILPVGAEMGHLPLRWDDLRLRRIPTRAVRLDRWHGRSEHAPIATPGEVLEALTAAAAEIAAASRRDLDLLRRLL
jgi:hypothetical protein